MKEKSLKEQREELEQQKAELKKKWEELDHFATHTAPIIFFVGAILTGISAIIITYYAK